jgi:hypothetical protein
MVECADLILLAAAAFAYERPRRDPPLSSRRPGSAMLCADGRAPDLAPPPTSFLELENSPLGHLPGRGTKSSNPVPSSGESGANLIFGGEPHRWKSSAARVGCRWPWASTCRLISSPRRSNSHLSLDFLPFLPELFDFDLKLLRSHVIAIFLCLFLFCVYLFH